MYLFRFVCKVSGDSLILIGITRSISRPRFFIEFIGNLLPYLDFFSREGERSTSSFFVLLAQVAG